MAMVNFSVQEGLYLGFRRRIVLMAGQLWRGRPTKAIKSRRYLTFVQAALPG